MSVTPCYYRVTPHVCMLSFLVLGRLATGIFSKSNFHTPSLGHFAHQPGDCKDWRYLTKTQINSKGQLISSQGNQRFMVSPGTWRTFQGAAIYNYCTNGLLKWIPGYSGKVLNISFTSDNCGLLFVNN